MILIEELLSEAFTNSGIKSSVSESVDWTEDYVLFQRTGGTFDAFGSDLTGWSGREEVDVDLNVYSMNRKRALELSYSVYKICRDLPQLYSAVSNVKVDSVSQLPIFNKQYGYTFGLTAWVLQNDPEED